MVSPCNLMSFFFFNDTATTEIYTLSLHDALPISRRRGLQAELVLAGPGHQAGSAGAGRTLSYVPPDDLPALYAGAIALTVPSRFEGFGFPALEAMRCGTAVIGSTAGALPEIIGTAGILLSPDDAGAWSQAMLELAHDPALQRRLIAAGTAPHADLHRGAPPGKTRGVRDRVARQGRRLTTH